MDDHHEGAKERQTNLRVHDHRIESLEHTRSVLYGCLVCATLIAVLTLLTVAIIGAQGVEEREQRAELLIRRLEGVLADIEAERMSRIR